MTEFKEAPRLEPRAGRSGRSVTLAPHGMVCTSQPLAAQAGLDVLRRGGTAVDAAIATNAALGVVEPMSCGVGGDLFAILWDAETRTLHGLNASGRSPYTATRGRYVDHGLSQIPLSGPLSWSVPGCVDGWSAVHQRFGKLPLSELLAPSIRYAEEGFPVTEVIAGYWRSAERFRSDPGWAHTYLVDGRTPRAGEVFRNPSLARTYREIAEEGSDAFYRGRIAREMVRFSEEQGGLFTERDFTNHASTWEQPVCSRYRGYQVWELPPPGQGIAALQMLNLLEGYDLTALGPESAEYWHLMVEAKKLAYADRARYYCDPRFSEVPTEWLISKAYAGERREMIRPDRALTHVPAGDSRLGHADTVYLSVVDRDRNCVSFIQSNFTGFGSGMVPSDLGFALQNRGALFALDPGHANRLEPHRRPFHTIIPALVTREGEPWLVFGVMGGDMQPQGHAQVLVNLIDFGMNVQAAGEAPRVEHVGSATPTGLSERERGGSVEVEAGIPDSVIEGLAARGHQVVPVERNGGGYQAILIDPDTNMLHGGTEARKDGAAVGY